MAAPMRPVPMNARFMGSGYDRGRGLGFGVWGLGVGVLGFGVGGWGFGVWGLGFGLGTGVTCSGSPTSEAMGPALHQNVSRRLTWRRRAWVPSGKPPSAVG